VDVSGGAELRFDGSHGFLSLRRAPARQDDLRSVTSKFQGGKVADPADCRPCAELIATIHAGTYVQKAARQWDLLPSCLPFQVRDLIQAEIDRPKIVNDPPTRRQGRNFDDSTVHESTIQPSTRSNDHGRNHKKLCNFFCRWLSGRADSGSE
jgi:hypothetical protein